MLKLRVRPKLPAKIIAGFGTLIGKAGLVYTISFDLSHVNVISTFNPLEKDVLLFDPLTGEYSLTKVGVLIQQSTIRRVITAAGNVTIAPEDGLIILKKTVAADTDFILPADITKIGPVKIVDWDGIADAHTLRVVPFGTEKLNGQSSWQLAGAFGSLVCTPIGTGLGYAL